MSIRQLPAVAERVETGAVCFGDDWPGIFIRGDNAFGYIMQLRYLKTRTEDPLVLMAVESLEKLLGECILTGLPPD